MKVKFFGDFSYLGEFDLNANSLREILSLLKMRQGESFMSRLLSERYYFILSDSKHPDAPIALTADVLLSSFTGYDALYIIPDVDGEWGLAAAVVAYVGATGIAAAAITVAVNVIVSVAISLALNAIMSALSPTPEFSKDPSSPGSQNSSNLFNGAPIIREQGGSVPLIFGNPYCGGVLISSGIFSESI